MRKIPTLFVRDWDGDPRYVTPVVDPECDWVIMGEGVPTRKYDGTCVMFDGEDWWARREVKKDKQPPTGFMMIEHDPETCKSFGWEPMEQSAFVKFHAEAVRNAQGDAEHGWWPVGTYELLGPKINGNPEGFKEHFLMYHAFADKLAAPRTYSGLSMWLRDQPYEGVVWHHRDGRMAKIKKRDFPQ